MTTATATFEDIARIEAMIPIRKLFEGVKKIITSAGRIAKCALTTIIEKAQAYYYAQGPIPPDKGALIEKNSGLTNPAQMLSDFHSRTQLIAGVDETNKKIIRSALTPDKSSSPVKAVRGVVNFIRTTLDI